MSASLDPYTSQAQNNDITLQEKINGIFFGLLLRHCLTSINITGLKEIMVSTKTAMLTTRSADGQFHSRAMNPVSRRSSASRIYLYFTHSHTAEKDNQLSLTFIANNVSHKFEELENDSHVNVSFLNPDTTSWAS